MMQLMTLVKLCSSLNNVSECVRYLYGYVWMCHVIRHKHSNSDVLAHILYRVFYFV